MKPLKALMTGLLIACVVLLCAGVYVVYSVSTALEDLFPGVTAQAPDRIRFLDPAVFDPDAPGAAIVLHPFATGLDTPILVNDPDALRAASQAGVFFTDDPGHERRVVAMSILALSPPTQGTRERFVDLVGAGQVETRYSCFLMHCRDPERFASDLGELRNSGIPVRQQHEIVRGAQAARAFAADILSRPDHVLISGTETLPEVSGRFDGYVTMQLPITFAPVATAMGARLGAEEAAFDTALRRLAERVDFAIETDRHASEIGSTDYMVVEHATGRIVGLSSVGSQPYARLRARIWLDEADLPALRAAVMSHDWPAATPLPDMSEYRATLEADIRDLGLDGPVEAYGFALRGVDPYAGLTLSPTYTMPTTTVFYFAPDT